MMKTKRYSIKHVIVLCSVIAAIVGLWVTDLVAQGPSSDGSGELLGMGLPLGAAPKDAQTEICPQGAYNIALFLQAWKKEEYKIMYDLIDDASKTDYPYEKALFDFRLMEYKDYTISSIRQKGEDFEFILSYGDWELGTKETKKLIVNGKTCKIKMATKNSPFKNSAENFF